MSKTVLTSFVILCLLSTVILTGLVLDAKAAPTTIYVDDDNTLGPWDGTHEHPYQNIASGLEHASANDTIFVYNGTYRYERLSVDKTVSLVGENSSNTIIEGFGRTYDVAAINISANLVGITGFTIRKYATCILLVNSSNSTISENVVADTYHGIALQNSSNNVLSNNSLSTAMESIRLDYSANNFIQDNLILNGDGFAITLSNSLNNDVQGNLIENNQAGIVMQYSSFTRLSNNNVTGSVATGIIMTRSDNNSLTCNLATGNNAGISLHESSHNHLSGNVVNDNPYGGIGLVDSHHNILFNNTASRNRPGIWILESINNTISGNVIDNNWEGISLHNCSNSFFLGNSITNSGNGASVEASSHNSFCGNTIIGSEQAAIYVYEDAFYNVFFHNNFINNSTPNIYLPNENGNAWDNGHPSGGNYWSDYKDLDVHRGPYQNETGSDGIGDTPHPIGYGPARDRYPLVGMFRAFNATSTQDVEIVSNSSVFGFGFNGTAVVFMVSGEDIATGFCRVLVPTSLMYGIYRVFVSGIQVQHPLLPCTNSTHSYLYFTYNYSTREVITVSSPLTEYYELLEKYSQLSTEFGNLNSTYHNMLASYASLLADFDTLNSTYHSLLKDCNSLNSTYHTLQNDYKSLLADFNALDTNHDLLNSSFGNLQANFNSLNLTYHNLISNYDNLQSSYDELQSDKEAVIDELGTIKNLMYIFIATTIILLATTIYAATKKPKTTRET